MIGSCNCGRTKLHDWSAAAHHGEVPFRASPKQLRFVGVQFKSVRRHPVVDVRDALLKSYHGRQCAVATTMYIPLCVVGERMELDAVLVGFVSELRGV